MPNHDGVVHIGHRGFGTNRAAEQIDYQIRFGPEALDLAAVSAIVKRLGIRAKHLEGRLKQFFETLANEGIQGLDVHLPGRGREARMRLKIALRIITGFNPAVEKQGAIAFKMDGRQFNQAIVCDDKGRADHNLTLLAALNNLSPAATGQLVEKMAALRKTPKAALPGLAHLSVYNTIWAVKRLRQQLVRPPIEVDTDRSPRSGPGRLPAAPGEREPAISRTPDAVMGDAAVKAEVAACVRTAYEGSPVAAGRVMKSIYGTDYKLLDSRQLGTQLSVITDFLSRLEKSGGSLRFMEALHRQIQAGMERMPAEMLEDIVVEDNRVTFWDGDSASPIATVGGQLARIIEGTKTSLAAKRKARARLRWEEGFSPEDYQRLAAHYGLAREAAEDICRRFERCFDRKGNFQRTAFEQQLEGFSRHPEKIFEILWDFLKNSSRRSVRLPLLNSFQMLNDRIRQPIKMIRCLLSDFVVDPAAVSYPDRNAMMLAIQLLRSYNKERHLDIEITPEEVLAVRGGLEKNVTNYAAWKVDGGQQQFIEKFINVRKALVDAMAHNSPTGADMPYRFLLALEREVHIFLALAGGKSATEVIRSGLSVYGDPDSEIFKLGGDVGHIGTLLQHLAVLIRSAARVGEWTDIALLEEIGSRKTGFLAMEEGPRHRALVRRVLGWSDFAVREIRSRRDRENR